MLRKLFKKKVKEKTAAKPSYPHVLDKPDLSFSELKAIWKLSIEGKGNEG
jgi:hypothetical protein